MKIDVTSLTNEETKEKMKELYRRVDGVLMCTACEYKTKDNSNIKRHAETHLEGLSYSCNLCDKDFRFRDSLNKHKYTAHKI